ncbi:MAG: hypothetical protein WCD49_09510 [Candidatus Acidiferrales bacterium]
MKKLILLASLAFAASVTHAQCPYARAAAAASSHAATSASGGPGFEPSTYVGYSEALSTGQEQLKAKSGLAEAARTAQAAKNSASQKPVLVADQDDAGNMVVSKPRKTSPSKIMTPATQGKLNAVNRQAPIVSEMSSSSSGRQ